MIPDFHVHPAHWGVRPILFYLNNVPVPSYSFFVALGLVAAIVVYYVNVRGKTVGHNGLYIALAALFGGTIGAKIPIWVANYKLIFAHLNNADYILSGRTIVGGIIGGALAVYFTKKRLKIKERLGNYLVPALSLGLFFGRIGCFLQGCCYGKATRLPWGVNFGDGITRHPTQLYEAFFVLMIFIYSEIMKDKYKPGELFRQFMIVYFSYRFLAEFIRVNPVSAVGLTYYQIVSIMIVAYYIFKEQINGLMKGVLSWIKSQILKTKK